MTLEKPNGTEDACATLAQSLVIELGPIEAVCALLDTAIGLAVVMSEDTDKSKTELAFKAHCGLMIDYIQTRREAATTGGIQ